jgi:hypothetical protein
VLREFDYLFGFIFPSPQKRNSWSLEGNKKENRKMWNLQETGNGCPSEGGI